MNEAVDKVGMLFGGGAMQHKQTGEMKFFLGHLDLDHVENKARTIDMGFLAHGITPSPHDPNHALCFEKHGPGCCAVDLAAGEILQTITTQPQRQFYGHGAFSADGKLLYCTETDLKDRMKGYIAVRDGKTYEYLGDFPSFGLAPHDCLLVDDGKTLIVANGGSPFGCDDGPNVAYVDVASQALVERISIGNARINAGHLAYTAAGDLAVVSAPRDGLDPEKDTGGISLRCAGEDLHTISEPTDVTSRMKGETLSVAIHEPTGVVGATNPMGNVVTFWNLRDGSFIKLLRVPNPRGIAVSLRGDEFILNFGTPPRAARVNAVSLVAVDAPGNQHGYTSMATGSHILMYDLPS